MELNKDTALKLLHKKMQNVNLRRHCYAVGFALRSYFDYFKSKNIDTGDLSNDEWEIVGILHDADWEQTKDDETKHTIKLLEWLKDYEVKEEILNVFKSHNNKTTHLREPVTLLEWTLECCDELTGFIVAIALVMPSKKLADVQVETVIKKFSQKEFAKAVDRNQIKQCEEKINIDLNTFIDITLKAMQKNHELLNL